MDIQKRGISRNSKVSTVNIQYPTQEFPVLVELCDIVAPLVLILRLVLTCNYSE